MKDLINYYRYKELGGSYFLTTDHGSFCILNKEEFEKLKNEQIDEALLKKLEEKEIIINEKNINEVVRLSKKRNKFLFCGASLHIIVVTLRCNMNCIYCHASSKPESKKEYDMTGETATKTVDFVFQSPSPKISIEFQGGEPLLNWEIIKHIVEYSLEKNKEVKKEIKFSIVSNLEEMDEEKLNYILKHNIDICTSLDGQKQLHDSQRICSKTSNYETVIKWIRRFNEEYSKKGIKEKKINALLTLTKESLSYPKEIVDEYVKNNLEIIHLRWLNKLGVAKSNWKKLSFYSEEYISFWKKAVEYIEELKEKGIKIEERMKNIIENKIGNEEDPNFLDLRNPCGAIIGQITYDYDGTIYSCDEARMVGEDIFKFGNVGRDKYIEVLSSKKACALINSSINDQYLCDSCVFKPYCGLCPVCNYAETGNIIPNLKENERCKILVAQFEWVTITKFIKNKC
jgi:uncharacterized protein